ncbi:MAG: hypothetical protein OXF79_24420 [Chloroflexi bacterium]|nr:hypothetical protein [Chloroflexota bacterium]
MSIFMLTVGDHVWSYDDFVHHPMLAEINEGDDNVDSIVLQTNDGCDGLSDPLGDGFDVPVPEMSVAQRHADVGMTEQVGDHGDGLLRKTVARRRQSPRGTA